MLANILGFVVPYSVTRDNEPNPAIETDQTWRFVFIFPAVLALIQSLLVLLVFRYDTPKYYKQNGKAAMVDKVEEFIYSERPSEINKSMVDTGDQKGAADQEEKVSISALFSPRYRKAFIVGCLLAVFQQLTGINAVIFYSNDIFTRGREGFDSERAAKIGTMLVGVINWAAALTAIPLLTKFGRRTLLILGQIAMGISLLVLAILAIVDWSTGIMIFTFFFVAFFEFSIGPILWLYAAEIMTESGMAAASLITWIVTIIFGLFTPRLFDLLKPVGMYFAFTGIDIVGLFFIIFFIKETMGKSKAEIKNLYSDRPYQNLGVAEEDDEGHRTKAY
jgi:MFS family permease